MRIDIHGSPQKIRLDPASGDARDLRALGGQFFSEILRLQAGDYAVRVQIIFSEAAAGERITILARSLADQAVLDRLELAATAGNRPLLDDQYLRFRLLAEQEIEICGRADAHCSTTLLRYLTVVDVEDDAFNPEDFSFDGVEKLSLKDLGCVIFGTTAVCNASCLHCPTNKDYRKHFPHGYMSFELFSKIIEELAEGGYAGWFLFGLFGEPLEDPLFERRLLLIKQRLPEARISVATNCGVYDPNKHAFIVDLADNIGVHVEGVSPEVYNRFMHPLKAERVFPKILALLGIDKANKVHITTPVHKGNLVEVPNLRRYFESYGAAEPHFTHLGNRSWDGGPWSELALAPVGGWCHPSDLRSFVVDWDGAVLACCLDFSKSAQLGDLSTQSVSEVLNGEAWAEMFEVHRTKRWSSKPACSRCRYDHADIVQGLVQTLLGPDDRAQRLSPRVFHLSAGVNRDAEGSSIHVGQEAANGIVIYGPYRSVGPGRYRISHFIEVLELPASAAYIEIDIVTNGVQQIASKGFRIDDVGPLELGLEFDSEGANTEFRIAKQNVQFVHKGALLHQLDEAASRGR